MANVAYKAGFTVGWLSVFIIFEFVYAYRIAIALPYHMLALDKFEIFISIVNSWIALIIILANIAGYNDGEDFFGIILLVLVTPGVILITNYFINH